MPNTLAHLGVNGIFSRSVIKDADLILIYIGAVIPDIPWILQRIIPIFSPNVNLYDLRLYSIILASLFFSLIFSGFLSILFENRKKVFLIFTLGSLLHLLLDSAETKWGNGVHFFAPFSWEIFNAGFFWPESIAVYLVTALGLLYVLTFWKKSINVKFYFSDFNYIKLVLALLLLTIYFLLPLSFMATVENADNHFIKTLRDKENRVGKYFEVDRGELVNEKNGDKFLTPFKEKYEIANRDFALSATMSLKAKFISESEIEILDYHLHSNRDVFSYIGLFIITLILVFALIKKFNSGRLFSGF